MKYVDFRDSQVLITGGAGFIGSNLAEALVENGAKITIVDAMLSPYGGNIFNLLSFKNKIKFIKGDVRHRNLMKQLVLGKDYIFHLAAQTGRLISMKNPRLDFDINFAGTFSLLEAVKLKNKKTKLIFASSRGVYGKPRYFPIDESHPTNPADIYGLNKLTAEKYCFMYGKNYGFGVSAVRLNNVYGPKCQIKSNHYGTVNLFIRYALQKIALPVFGDGKQTRDYLYVKDAVSALMGVANRSFDGECFLAGFGKEYSLLDIVKIIKSHVKKTTHEFVPYTEGLEKIDFPRFLSSNKKIVKIVGWKPKIVLRTGIKITVDYYKKHLNRYL